MMPDVPSTPHIARPAHPPPNRRLWTSPAISDYFSASGDDGSSWTFSPEAPPVLKTATTFSDAPRASSPDSYGGRTLQNSVQELQLSRSSQNQRHLLQRLNSVGRSILSGDLNDEHCERLGLDIDRLESTIAAPESQSREPAENEVSGLFNDDETEASTILRSGALDNHEAGELVRRVTKAATELKQRFLEIKHTNDIAAEKLDAAAQEIARLRKENLALHETDSQSEILYLRLRLNALEERAKSHLDRRGQEELLDEIERLNIDSSPRRQHYDGRAYSIKSIINSDDVFVNDSKPTDGFGYRIMRLSSSKTPSRKPNSLSNGSVAYTSGLVTPTPEDADMEEIPKETGIAKEKGDGDGEEAVKRESLEENASKDVEVEKKHEKNDAKEGDEGENLENDKVNDETNEDESHLDNKKEEEMVTLPPQPRKTPWQMLLDDLADFAGIHDEYNEDEDEHLAY